MKRRSIEIVTVCLILIVSMLFINWSVVAAQDTTTITVDFGVSLGELNHIADGFLHPIQDIKPTDNLIKQVGIRAIRQAPVYYNNGELVYSNSGNPAFLYPDTWDRIQDLENKPVMVANLAYDTSHVYEKGGGEYFPGDGGDWNTWSDIVEILVNKCIIEGYEGSYSLWNEPDFVFSSGNHGDWVGFCEAYHIGFDTVKSLQPNAKVAGPETSSYNYSLITSYLTYCNANDCIPDILDWHELGGDPSVIKGHVDQIKAWMSANNIEVPEIYITEYGSCAKFTYPGDAGGFITYLENSGVTYGFKANWAPAYGMISGNLPGLATNDGDELTGVGQVYKRYNEMSGDKVQVTNSNSRIVGLAAKDDSEMKECLLVSHNDALSATEKLVINLNNVSSNIVKNGNIHIKAERIDFTSTKECIPVVMLDSDFSITNNQITLSGLEIDQYAAIFLTISSPTGIVSPLYDREPTEELEPLPNSFFVDDFEDEECEDWINNGGSWDIVTDGTTKALNFIGGTNMTLAGDNLTDFTMQGKVKTLDRSGAAGLVFRVGDDDNFYLFRVSEAVGKAELYKSIQGVKTLIASKSMTLRTNTWYSLKVSITGNHINCFVDDVKVIDWTNPINELSSGKIGIRAANYSRYDDISVAYNYNRPSDNIFSDDFEDGDLSGWTTLGGTWSVQPDESKVLEVAGLSENISYVDMPKSNYTMQGRVKILTSGGNAGLVFRAVDNNNFYTFRINDGTNKAELYKKTNGTMVLVSSGPIINVNPYEWYNLEVNISGNHMIASVNGDEMIDWTNPLSELLSGKVGFRSTCNARYDEIIVKPNILYKDDFEDGNIDGWVTSGGTWSIITDGSKSLNVSGLQENIATITGSEWADCDIEGDVKIITGNGNAGFIFRAFDSNNFYTVRINDNTKKVELYKKVRGTMTLLCSSAAIPININEWYTLKVNVYGNNIIVYINGETVLDWTNPLTELTSGNIGIRSTSSSSYDNIVVIN